MGSRLCRVLALLVALLSCTYVSAAEPFELRDGDRVVFLGDALIEREQHFGWLELALTTRFPDRNVTFRNLGWSGDTPAGVSRCGLSLLQAGHEPPDEGWKLLQEQIRQAKPTVVFLGYGMASSFTGAEGLVSFKADMVRLMDAIAQMTKPAPVRFVILSPIPHLPSPVPLDRAGHNRLLRQYTEALRALAIQRNATFISLFDGLNTHPEAAALADNGIHLNGKGYRALARAVEISLGWRPGSWLDNTQSEALRQVILKKNEWFFHRSRPANMAYVFGFRKGEQGRNAVEIPQFDPLIEAEEQKIALLRSLQPVDLPPEPPRRTQAAAARFTPQPRPSFEAAPGLEVNLWAENPQLHKPIQMNFDPQGRLWVASSEVYPQVEPGQTANDKIIILEDTTGTGKADKATVFADGLLIPTGLEPGDGGVYVAQSTELLHLKDTDGDGKADVRRVVLSGFGTEDTHHNLHTLRWGHDGYLWMNQSIYTRSDVETPHGVVRLKSGGVMRWHPRTQKMEVVFRGWWNSWGHQFDAFGQSFLTDGAGDSGINYGLPGATYVGYARPRRILQGISPGSYPKFCSLEIIRSQHFPDDWQGDHVTCDFRANRVVRFRVSEQGAGYFAEEVGNVLRTREVSFRPIDVKLGPDGALYVADWSNPIINHGEVDFRDPRRDREHGRIWRITCKGRPLNKQWDLTDTTFIAAFEGLKSPNGYDRVQARRFLTEGGHAILPKLTEWSERPKEDKPSLETLWVQNAQEAVWLREALGVTDANLLKRVLGAKDHRIRAAAVRVLANVDKPLAPEWRGLTLSLLGDDHPRVRLEAVRALGKAGTAEAADLALRVLDRPMDRFLDYALWLTMNELAEPWLTALAAGKIKTEGREQALAFGLSAVPPEKAADVLAKLLVKHPITREGRGAWIELVGRAGGQAELRLLFDKAVGNELDDPAAVRAMTALTTAARLRRLVPSGDLQGLQSLVDRKGDVRTAAIRLAGAWRLSPWAQRLAALAVDKANTLADRAAACEALRDHRGAVAATALRTVATDGQEQPKLRRQALLALASVDSDNAMPLVRAALTEVEGPDVEGLWRELLGLAGMGKRLTESLRHEPVPRGVASAGLRVALESDERLRELASVLAKIAGQPTPKVYTTAELQEIARQARVQGDPERGEMVYRRADLKCLTCHAIGGAGGKVGPDLTSLGASAPLDYLVESMLAPGRKIKEGYHAVVLLTNDGRVFSGIPVRETALEVVLRDATDKEIAIPVQAIDQRGHAGSLMPSGLLDPLNEQDRLDLFRFLGELGRPGPFDATQSKAARAWRVVAVASDDAKLAARARQGDPTLPWTTIPSTLGGWLPKREVQALAANDNPPKTLFAITRFDARKSGTCRLQTNLSGRTSAWLDGKPITLADAVDVELTTGTSALVIQLDLASMPERLRLESADVVFLGQ